jgi:hypothetical protein
MRLLTAAEELRNRIAERVGPESRERFERTRPTIAFAQTHTNDLETFTAGLDELCAQTAGFLVEGLEDADDG